MPEANRRLRKALGVELHWRIIRKTRSILLATPIIAGGKASSRKPPSPPIAAESPRETGYPTGFHVRMFARCKRSRVGTLMTSAGYTGQFTRLHCRSRLCKRGNVRSQTVRRRSRDASCEWPPSESRSESLVRGWFTLISGSNYRAWQTRGGSFFLSPFTARSDLSSPRESAGFRRVPPAPFGPGARRVSHALEIRIFI